MFELVKELAAFEKAPEKVTVSLDHFINSGFGESPVWWAFVAAVPSGKSNGDEEFVIGFALYYIRFSTWKGQRMYLEDLLVTESYRGQGVGTLLFDRLLTEAKEKNLNGLCWQVLDWNEPAIRFYKKYDASLDFEWANGDISFN